MTEQEIFEQALDRRPDERAAFLDTACSGDATLRRRLEALLRSHTQALGFLDVPALEQLTSESGRENAVPDLSFLTPSARPDSLGRLGHYEVLEVLGKGGFGIVLRAFDETLQRVVAVKVLAPQLAVTSPARKRFVREARSSARIRHENVVHVYAVEEQPLPYLVMEFIPGETLQQRSNRSGPLEVPEVLRIGRQIAAGLAAAHATGLIHRDIKPANVLIERVPHEPVKLTDFGLARAADDASVSQSGTVVGTPMYMAPEQARGERLDHRADLFSLGSVLYTMCSGRPPFRANSTLAVLRRVAEDTPRPIREIIPEVPQWLCDIISRLQAKNPEDRFASAQEVADLLARHLARLQYPGNVPALLDVAPVVRNAPVPKPAIKPRARIGRWMAAAVGALLLVGLGFTEANGVTNVGGTVIRLFSPEGTLVIEVDDPGVSIKVEGSDVVITGAGAKEIRLKPGSYTVEARKDGKVVSRELVTVTKNGKQVVRVSQEAVGGKGPGPKTAPSGKKPPIAVQPPAPTVHDTWIEALADLPLDQQGAALVARMNARLPGFEDAFRNKLAAMPADRQVALLTVWLKVRNPGFDGQVTHKIEDGVVTEIGIGRNVTDLSPVRALTGLKVLNHSEGPLSDLSPLNGLSLTRLAVSHTQVHDLSPLKGMPLTYLNLDACKHVRDLSPLKGMPLTSLNLHMCAQIHDLTPLKGMPLTYLNLHDGPKVRDLSPLKGMPLTELLIGGNPVQDLSPLKGLKLTALGLSHCSQVQDLSPLKGMKLTLLYVDDTQVRDLEPLKDMPLKHLYVDCPGVTDLRPLQDMRLEMLCLTPKNITQGLGILRDMKSLTTVGINHYATWPAAEFWARYDKGEFTK